MDENLTRVIVEKYCYVTKFEFSCFPPFAVHGGGDSDQGGPAVFAQPVEQDEGKVREGFRRLRAGA